MNEETDKKNAVSDNNTFSTPIPAKPPVSTAIIAIVAIVIIVGGVYFYSNHSKTRGQRVASEERRAQSFIPEDVIFSTGFKSTGREWPPKEKDWSEELKQNQLCELRKSYCERVGYKYADFGCDCFVYQYYDSYSTYTNDGERFTVSYPRLWQKYLESSSYELTSDPKISLKREGASCTLRYGIVNEDKLLSFSNASTSKLSFFNYTSGKKVGVGLDAEGLNKIALPFGRDLVAEEKASGYTNLKLIAVPHFPYGVSKFGFLLTSGDKQPLIEACVKEFDSILESRDIDYSPAKLTNQSTGLLAIQKSREFQSFMGIPQKTVLLFENSVTGRGEAIASETFSDTQRIWDLFLTGNKLYYLQGPADNPVVKTVDIFTGEGKVLPIPHDESQPIHSFFVRGDILYYLTGKFCNEYLLKCSLNLASYNLKSGVAENLASEVKSRDIEGFNASGDTLILQYSEGDAACVWGRYESFTLPNKTIKELGSYSYCDTGPEELVEDPSAKFRNLVSGVDDFSYLIIKNGKILLPSAKTIYYPVRKYIKVNTTEYSKAE